MDEAERIVRELVAATPAGERVGSVASICEATGLSTGAGIEVVTRFMTLGLVRSTRGRDGGYWRTELPFAGESDDLAAEMRTAAAELTRVAAQLTAIADKMAGTT